MPKVTGCSSATHATAKGRTVGPGATYTPDHTTVIPGDVRNLICEIDIKNTICMRCAHKRKLPGKPDGQTLAQQVH